MIVSTLIPYDDRSLESVGEIPVIAEGSTCVCTLAHVDGCLMFRKALRKEFVDKEVFRTSFRKEFEVGRKIDSPFVVKYNKFVCETDDASLYMDYVEGNTLEEALHNEPEWFANPKNLYKCLNQLLCGLRCLHEQQLVHLDLSVSNIMLTKVNHDVKIIDLGYCYSSAYPSAMGTTTGFCAPELFENNKNIDARADIYSFGKIVQYICKMIKSSCKSSVINRLKVVAERCCKQNAGDRYMSVADVEKALGHKSSHKLFWRVIFSILVCFCLFLSFWLTRNSNIEKHTETLSGDTCHEQMPNGSTTHAVNDDNVTDVVTAETISSEALPEDTVRMRKPKHSFPFPAVVDDRNRIYAKIGSTDDLSKIPLFLKMVCNVDMADWQINVVLPDSVCSFLMENDEYNRLISKNIRRGGKVRYVVLIPYSKHSVLSRVCDFDDGITKGEDDVVVTYFDGSKLSDGKYTVRLYDGIVNPYGEDPTRFITDEIILTFKISNGAVIGQNRFF